MLRKIKVCALVALLALAAPEAAQAVVTSSVTITNSSWTLLGAGPLQITPNGSIAYAISDTPPAIPLGGGFKASAGSTVIIQSPSNVYAVATTGASTSVYIAPLPAPGTVSLTWPGSAVVTSYGTAPTGTVPAVNAFVTNPATFTWPGTAAVTTYGVAPTGTVPAVNAFVTGGASTFTWPGTAALTNYGTAPTGTVPAVNAFVTNPSSGGGPLGVQAIGNSQAVNPATASIWPTSTAQWGGGTITNSPTAVGTAGTGNTPTINAFIVGGGGGAVTQASGSVAAGAYSLGSYASGALVDGASVTMGTTGDAAWVSGAGTEIALLKKIATGGSGGGPVTQASGSVSAGAYSLGSYVAGALVDGAIATMGTQADTVWSGVGSGTEIAILKKIATGGSGGGPITIASGAVASGAYSAGSFVVGALADGAITTIGTQGDSAWSGAGPGTEIAILKKISAATTGVVTQPTASLLNATVVGPAGAPLSTSANQTSEITNQSTMIGNQTNGSQKVQNVDISGNTIFNAAHPGLVACPDGTTTCFGGAGGSGTPPFTPDLSYSTPLGVTTASTIMALPAAAVAGSVVKLYNAGPNTLYWTVGTSAAVATTSNSLLAPQSWDSFIVKAGQTSIAAITKIAGQTATLNAESGAGMPQGTGGPINASVVPNAAVATFFNIIGGVDNTGTAASRLGVTAAGTSSNQGVMPSQGVTGGVPMPSIPAPNITGQSCFAGPLVANVAQNLVNISTSTNGFMVQNIDAAAGGGEAVWISFVGTAAIGAVDSFALPPPTNATTMANSGSFTTPNWFGTKGPVSVIAATSGHKISCVLGHP